MRKTLKIDIDEHIVGDESCQECWPDYPKVCECGGLVHASFGEEQYDGYFLFTACDVCGESEVLVRGVRWFVRGEESREELRCVKCERWCVMMNLLIVLGYLLVSSIICVLVDRMTGVEVQGDSSARVLHYLVQKLSGVGLYLVLFLTVWSRA